jgi:hypothetical protein
LSADDGRAQRRLDFFAHCAAQVLLLSDGCCGCACAALVLQSEFSALLCCTGADGIPQVTVDEERTDSQGRTTRNSRPITGAEQHPSAIGMGRGFAGFGF